MTKEKEFNIKDINKEEEPKKEETVEVKKSVLEAMEERMVRLESVANKARLFNFDKKSDEDHETIIRLRTLDEKVIISWKTLTNKVYRDPITKRIIEDQTLEVTFKDGSTETLNIATFSKRFVHIKTKVVEATDLKKPEDIKKYGIQKFKLEGEDGKHYEIGSNFVN